ncbi:biotin carboxyl carrier protein [Salinisphaera sp. PC39]|uniref:acetyl-CoA carboxylase biotin carboxyl carrier protein n=1 Tax=Salinisphaera sp. PC39 TaxID=1304156 RepID=UPI0033405362
MENIKPEDIKVLIELFDQTEWRELSLEVEGLNLFLSKDANAHRPQPAAPAADSAPAASPAPAAAKKGSAEPAAKPAASEASAKTGAEPPEGTVAVRAPNLGTFYRSPKPGAEPYVEVGQEVDEDTEICLIEVMKLFTPVSAGVKGVVRQICVEDGQMVEHDEPLIYIEPAE